MEDLSLSRPSVSFLRLSDNEGGVVVRILLGTEEVECDEVIGGRGEANGRLPRSCADEPLCAPDLHISPKLGPPSVRTCVERLEELGAASLARALCRSSLS